MPRRPRVANINELVAHINKQLDAFRVSYDQLNLRQRVEKLVEIRHGSDDLRPGEYVLLDSERIAEPHDRKITVEVQQVVYQRDENTCRKCMWKPENWTTSDPRILELHHFVEHAKGGKNTSDNLLVLCSRCHDDVHAGRIDLNNV